RRLGIKVEITLDADAGVLRLCPKADREARFEFGLQSEIECQFQCISAGLAAIAAVYRRIEADGQAVVAGRSTTERQRVEIGHDFRELRLGDAGGVGWDRALELVEDVAQPEETRNARAASLQLVQARDRVRQFRKLAFGIDLVSEGDELGQERAERCFDGAVETAIDICRRRM